MKHVLGYRIMLLSVNTMKFKEKDEPTELKQNMHNISIDIKAVNVHLYRLLKILKQ